MQSPTVFISSTIYDFRDLRSSLKFYLEEQGFKVLASDFNDFQKPLDRHSYDACLATVRSADYFILLIGTRIGGWYEEQSRLSITQREYQEAYKMHQAGKLKILSFVRSEVWQAKDDRSALRKHLKTSGLDAATQKSIANHESKSMEDAEFISNFISEVGRNTETIRAVQGHGVAPSGNWIHQFSTFRDIVDALNGQIFSSIPVEDMTTRSLLRRELLKFVSQCMVKLTSAAPVSPRGSIDMFHVREPLTVASLDDPLTRVSVKEWDKLSALALLMFGSQFRPIVLAEVLTRSTFLEFDLASNTYRQTDAYDAMVKLQDEIVSFGSANTPSKRKIIFAHTKNSRHPSDQFVDVDTMGLVDILGLFDRWANILELSVSLVKYIDGQPFPSPNLRPDTPIQGMQEDIDAEKPSESEIIDFISRY